MADPIARARPLFVMAFAALAAFDAYALGQDGYWSVFPPFARWFEAQMFADLAVALVLATGWIALDLRARGRHPAWALAWLLGCAAAGALAPLAYLATRPARPEVPA